MTRHSTSNSYFRAAITALLLLLCAASSFGQSSMLEPTREQLLNGLTIHYAQRPGDANVLLKLRIHSGAAFDLTDKAGTISLLADALFPDPATPEYVAEQLGGKLEVTVNYDAIDIVISGKASEFERLVDLLRGAILSTQLSPENIAKLRETRIKELAAHQDAATRANQAIIARLFGSFPYGHPIEGTPESVAKIDRAELLLARERFLNADNASLVVIGGVDKARAMRTVRQLLGPWRKGDRMVLSTFRAASPPDTRIQLIDQPSGSAAEIRVAVRGVARSDPDADAVSILARIAKDRWQASAPDLSSTFVKNEMDYLPGMFVLGGTIPIKSAPAALSAAHEVLKTLVISGPTSAEIDKARGDLQRDVSQQTSSADSWATLWLDTETYKLAPFNARLTALGKLTAADVQLVAVRLLKDAPIAQVISGSSDQLIQSFQSQAGTEVKNGVDPTTSLKKP